MSMIYGVMARADAQIPPGWIAAMDERATRWPDGSESL